MTWFRFSDLPTYRKLSGPGIRECDYTIWYDNTIWLLEYKDFRPRVDNPEPIPTPDELKLELRLKTSNHLLMLATVWLMCSDTSQALREEIPAVFHQYAPIKILYVVDFDATQIPGLLAGITPGFKQQLGFAKLLNKLASKEAPFVFTEPMLKQELPELRALLPDELEQRQKPARG